MNIIEQFIAHLQDEGKSKNTIRNYAADIRKVTEYFEGGTPGDGGSTSAQKVNEKFTQYSETSSHNEDKTDNTDAADEGGIDWNAITTADIRQFMDDMRSEGLSVSTINRRLQSTRTFFSYLWKEEIVADNPALYVKAKKIAKQNETKWLENHQVKMIFRKIDEIPFDKKRALYRAIFSTLVNTGLRAQELTDLKLSSIDWENGLLSVYGKGGKFRKVPFNTATQKNVKRWLEYRKDEGEYVFQSERSDHLSVRAVEHMSQKLSEELPFDFTVHQLRHTALKQIADTTGRIEIVASIAGHESVETSRRYIEPSLKEIGDAMKATEFDY